MTSSSPVVVGKIFLNLNAHEMRESL